MTTAIATLPALDELRPGKQWVCHNREKVPYTPTTNEPAEADDADTWDTYEEACKALKSNPYYTGIGREFRKRQKITGIDLDKCIDENGKLTAWARKIIDRLNSYTEISPSGTGIHIWVHGSIPTNIGPDPTGVSKIEMYDCKRYFTVTGKHLEGTPITIEDRHDALNALYSETKEARQAAKDEKKKSKPTVTNTSVKKSYTSYNGSPYGLRALELECDTLRSAHDGGRNTQLNTSAFNVGSLIAGDELDEQHATSELFNAALQAGLDEPEISKTLHSGLSAGMAQPRKAPPQQRASSGTITANLAPVQPAISVNGNGANGHSTAAPVATSPHPNGFHLTDLGNAERFAARYKACVRWCETWNSWLVHNDRFWEQDKSGRVDQLAKATVRAIYQEAAAEEDDAKRKQIVKHAASSESNRAIRAMLDRAKSELPSTPQDYNTHIYLLNCTNGTLDLRTGEMRPHTPTDMLTRCIDINYNPLAICSRWEDFINSIQQNNQAMVSFLQEALGMSLSGDVSEQCLFICHGLGSNGKTTMLEVVRTIMSTYAHAANIESFQMKQHEGINNDIAELYGARFVNAEENKVGSRLNEALIKKVTGKQPLRARRLHENEFQFMPEFTLWLSVNHKPVIKDDSKGMWRRVRFIPFLVTFEEKDINPHLTEELLQESEGILAWLVRGCLEWMRNGRLTIPDEVKAATEAYRAEMDVITNFISDECVTTFQDAKVSTTQLLETFEQWCTNNGEKYDPKQLKKVLHDRGYKSERSTGGRYVWHGIGLLDHTEEEVNVSEGSEGSEPKNRVNTRNRNTSQKTWNFGSLPSLPSLDTERENATQSSVNQAMERNEAQPMSMQDLFQDSANSEGTFTIELEEIRQLRDKLTQKKRASILWNGEYLPLETYLARLQAGLESDDIQVQNAAIAEITKHLEKE